MFAFVPFFNTTTCTTITTTKTLSFSRHIKTPISIHRSHHCSTSSIHKSVCILNQSTHDLECSDKSTSIVDYDSLWKYFVSLGIQLSSITSFLWLIQHFNVFPQFIQLFGINITSCIAYMFFLILAVRSRIFSPLPADRPRQTELFDLKRPKWFPPPIVFGIVWSTIGLILRPLSAFLVWNTLQYSTLNIPIFAYVLNLSIGDVWNYLQNNEKKLGVSLLFMFPVWLSSIFVTFAMFSVNPQAGYTILPLPIWLTAAYAIVFSTWNLNGRPTLLPRKKRTQQ